MIGTELTLIISYHFSRFGNLQKRKSKYGNKKKGEEGHKRQTINIISTIINFIVTNKVKATIKVHLRYLVIHSEVCSSGFSISLFLNVFLVSLIVN